ncbi:hypothetical protein RB653_005108 [Dictyostelium firmibasis]|uniref:DNA replication complex GINS protein PSF3 n=1 Tax=Dictyostelium firmibasis TaxID=79012 RepID=A0AAN7U786_9MYCE
MSYFDINDILAEEQKITCNFFYDAYNLGQLEEGSRDSDMKKGSSIDLPYWMALPLAKSNFVSVIMPLSYQDEYKNKLNTEPNLISMRNFPYYDKIGVQLSDFFGDRKLKLLLFKAFRDRFLDIYKKSVNLKETDISKILGNMTYQEREVFTYGYKSSLEYDKWRSRKGEKVEKNTNNLSISSSLSSSSSNNNNNNNNNSNQNSSGSNKSSQSTTVKKRKRMFDDE